MKDTGEKIILVSACLVGVNCTYRGGNNRNTGVLAYIEGKEWIPVCPEQLGGLSTPREEAEISAKRVFTRSGIDVSTAFRKGAEETLAIARLTGCSSAILKNGSPSCGSTRIYDGTFTGTSIAGKGCTAQLLESQNIAVFSEEDLPKDYS